ncbi:MAG TPA: FAD-dependent monooxygenase [Ktedonobacterales bacterium]
MKVVILGAGPAGMYCGLLLKKARPAAEITILERNPAGATYGWGVVFSDRTLASFHEADYPTYARITEQFVLWDAIDIRFRGELMRCGGHVFAGLARRTLLDILRERCLELGVSMRFETDITDLAVLPACDLFIAADGVNSLVRQQYAATFQPNLHYGASKYIWLGTNRVLDAFTFLFQENEHGLFQVHAYPFDGTTSTFIVETDEATWQRAGLDGASEAESIAYCERLFAEDLRGHQLLGNNSKWISFVTVKNSAWHADNTVLLGDAAHTAHFSIGSGTKLAMEDAIALVNALSTHRDLAEALAMYELERRPIVETLQQAAQESRVYFEGIARYRQLPPRQFAFNLLTRSGRISYDDLRLRDGKFVDALDRGFSARADEQGGLVVAPAPWLTPLALRAMTVPNRVAMTVPDSECAANGVPDESLVARLSARARAGSGLLMTPPVAIAHDARITASDAGIYNEAQQRAWSLLVAQVNPDHPHPHTAHVERSRYRRSPMQLGITLNHAGRRGSMQSRRRGLDVPLRDGGWPLVAPSALPYTPGGVVPGALDQAGMARIRDEFVQATRMAAEAGFDLLQLHAAHGYLLASFLSPLTNLRNDVYGGSLANRMRFPLEVVDAVRAAWPEDRPLAVALGVTDGAPGGLVVDVGVAVARALKEHGCDLINVMAGQTTPAALAPFRRGFLTPLADRVRNEAGVITLVGGYLVTSNEANTLLAAGRADLCMLEYPWPEEPVTMEAPIAANEEQPRNERHSSRRSERETRQEARHG